MTAVLIPPDERARKATSLVLQRLSPAGTQCNVAVGLGVSESTISRIKEHIEPVMRLCAQLGLKVVPVEMRCYAPEDLEAVFRLAKSAISKAESANDLLRWDE